MSEFFEWNTKSYGLNIPKMDEQHQIIIAKMNKLYDLKDKDVPRPELAKLLRELVDYTVKHFAEEEEYMASFNYEGLEAHKAIHEHLLGKIIGYADRHKETGELGENFFRFLKVWLTGHIQGIDTKYAAKVTAA